MPFKHSITIEVITNDPILPREFEQSKYNITSHICTGTTRGYFRIMLKDLPESACKHMLEIFAHNCRSMHNGFFHCISSAEICIVSHEACEIFYQEFCKAVEREARKFKFVDWNCMAQFAKQLDKETEAIKFMARGLKVNLS